MAAVSRIVRHKGVEGIRVRDVAAEAAVSPGAVLYHFPKNADLLLAVHEATVQQYLERRTAAATSLTDPREQLLAVVRSGVPPWADEEVIRVFYEMHGLARRSDVHAQLMSRLWEQEHGLYVRIIRSGIDVGLFRLDEPVEDVASRLLALEDGMVLHLIGHNPALTPEEVIRHITGMAASALHQTS